jgi:hypothetical protein
LSAVRDCLFSIFAATLHNHLQAMRVNLRCFAMHIISC